MSGVRGGDEPLSYPGPPGPSGPRRLGAAMSGLVRLGDDERGLVVTVEGRVKSVV